ncbi:MAG: sigma-70 family RNA polymerase sigma factor [Acidobacteria bacterium]|nr:sigma-70 family RNA polymerase sigma factor [Acidobacteriota bacterium]MBI3424747.1 sigma-70 family RNA polymerase sigma factor [Acidobacteriota bacterium]
MTAEQTTSPHRVSQLLLAWGQGDQSALEQLAPLVDGELRRLAHHYLHKRPPDALLQTTALVNEAWLKLIDWQNSNWQNRAHFFGMAATLMRQILVDEARKRQYQKRQGLHVSLSEAADVIGQQRPDLLALDDALNALAAFDARKSRVVELRFFAGLNADETAEVLRVSPRTVARDWDFAQTWLYRELRKGASHA